MARTNLAQRGRASFPVVVAFLSLQTLETEPLALGFYCSPHGGGGFLEVSAVLSRTIYNPVLALEGAL